MMAVAEDSEDIDVTELSLRDIEELLRSGRTTSTELVIAYLNRVLYYDANGIRLNSMPLIAADAIRQAMRLDGLRARGTVLGPLHGVPYTVKDSYMAKGMTMAAGSPAFSNMVAQEDSFAVQALRAAGAILIGRTNMPPLAAGGMQRGVYGRAESPYNADYLAAAWDSGSSNGSAVSTAASFAAFGMGEETVSSGRSPASNNAVVAYTPSRGVISMRGNWVLHATKDVVVPHTRTVDDLLRLLQTLAVDDPDTRGDMWRRQQFVPLDDARRIHERGFADIADAARAGALAGLRIGVVLEYTGRTAGAMPGVYTRPSINRLLDQAVAGLRAAGAQVRWTGFPVRDQYESAPRTLRAFADQGLIPHDWMEHEWLQLNASALEEFLSGFAHTGPRSLMDVDADDVFPNPLNSVDYRTKRRYGFYQDAQEYIRSGRLLPSADTPELGQGLRGLEAIRRKHVEEWMRAEQLDVLVFPANGNVGRADADVDEAHNVEACQDGCGFSNGNRMIRHLGIPTVSVPMGIMDDTHMPVNLTFAGPSGSDPLLLAAAYEYEQRTGLRRRPPRVPALERHARIAFDPGVESGPSSPVEGRIHARIAAGRLEYEVRLIRPESGYACRVFVNGVLADQWNLDEQWRGGMPTARLVGADVAGITAVFTGVGGGVGGDAVVLANGDAGSSAGSLL
ncbi:MAG: amidase [Bifidobacterium tibiigranuli]|jgi:amidase|uniref:amidase n=2 Tax=Bifidobacterium tibiigranuli TaxID=2172043 RepID=UPI0026EFA27F|nr:amidase [Bifidobacterium tibiigranuli]MCI1673626.1 amidase [Bifidobacterium tibiigranuli]